MAILLADASVLVLKAVFIADTRLLAVRSSLPPTLTLYTVVLSAVVVVVPLVPVVTYLKFLATVVDNPVFIVMVRYSFMFDAVAPPESPVLVMLALKFDPTTMVSL